MSEPIDIVALMARRAQLRHDIKLLVADIRQVRVLQAASVNTFLPATIITAALAHVRVLVRGLAEVNEQLFMVTHPETALNLNEDNHGTQH